MHELMKPIMKLTPSENMVLAIVPWFEGPYIVSLVKDEMQRHLWLPQLLSHQYKLVLPFKP